MAQVGIKSSEGFLYPIQALEETQGYDVRVRDVQLATLKVAVHECVFVPEANRPVLLPGIELTEADLALQVSVIEVSGVGPFINILGR